ncbi:MAG TPA: aminomethyltransferase family protein [Burkholderiales bacterium]|nr:aminomethyltransferase family protein [Burkholderiales bacterium]
MRTLEDYFKSRGVALTEIAAGSIMTPAFFSDAAEEHLATRHAAGLFDFSFMACCEIRGNSAEDFVEYVQTRSLSHLAPGRIAYTLLLRDDGSVLNDATIWHHSDDRYWLFTGRRSDLGHLAEIAVSFDIELIDRSQDYAAIAVQGPHSWRVVNACWPPQSRGVPPPYYSFVRGDFEGTACWLARLGYSGETGCELIVEAAMAAQLWQRLCVLGAQSGLAECGFLAMNSLRIEAGHIFFGCELASALTPFELGLSRLVTLRRQSFHGSAALLQHARTGPRRRLIGLLPKGNDVPAGTAGEMPAVPAAGTAIVTSAAWSPLFRRPLALGIVNAADRRSGSLVQLADSGTAVTARLPFYDPAKILPRRVPNPL